MRRLRRLRGILGVAGARTLARVRHGNRTRVLLSVTGVALAVALMVVVTATSLGLATETTVYGANVDYWIVPESGSASTMAVSVGGPQFGAVHETSARLTALPGVEFASPVAVQLLRVAPAGANGTATASSGGEYVLTIGVVSHDGLSVAGLPSDPLTVGDPYYANGSYDGPWTGESVVSSAAANLLNVSRGDRVTVSGGGGGGARAFHVTAVANGSLSSGAGNVPVMLVHLSELQAVTGGTSDDTANQLLVHTNDPRVKSALASVYPHSRVVERSGVGPSALVDADLALAIALTAFLVALVIGTLFVATALGLEVTADRPQVATLAAVGVSQRSQTVLVAAEAVCVTALGGVAGVALGALGTVAANRLAASMLGTGRVAVFHPGLVVYGLVVAVGIGLLAAPYLAWVARGTNTLDHLSV